ncbi:MAG: hypothetical protein E7218_09135 [Anaerofustis stercorihominis]|nr:hypothetical protein [Anaerofustis stercorihominis]
MLISVFGCNQRPVSVETTIREISKYGNIELEYSATAFLEQGFAYGDIITVNIAGTQYEMPIGSNYADVDTNSLVCRLEISAESGDDNVILAINMGDLATDAGIAKKEATQEEPGYRWDYCEGFERTSTITISLKESGGYLEEYTVCNLVRTNERTD